MINFNKVLASKIISLILVITFFLANISYAGGSLQGSLRVPAGEKRTYERIKRAAEEQVTVSIPAAQALGEIPVPMQPGAGTAASAVAAGANLAPVSWSQAGKLPDEITEQGGYVRKQDNSLEQVNPEELRKKAKGAIEGKVNGDTFFMDVAGAQRMFILRKIPAGDKTFDIIIDQGAASQGEIAGLLEKALAGFSGLLRA